MNIFLLLGGLPFYSLMELFNTQSYLILLSQIHHILFLSCGDFCVLYSALYSKVMKTFSGVF